MLNLNELTQVDEGEIAAELKFVPAEVTPGAFKLQSLISAAEIFKALC